MAFLVDSLRPPLQGGREKVSSIPLTWMTLRYSSHVCFLDFLCNVILVRDVPMQLHSQSYQYLLLYKKTIIRLREWQRNCLLYILIRHQGLDVISRKKLFRKIDQDFYFTEEVMQNVLEFTPYLMCDCNSTEVFLYHGQEHRGKQYKEKCENTVL